MTKQSKTNKVAKTTKKSAVVSKSTGLTPGSATLGDFKNSLLVVSVSINLAILIAWLAVKVTNTYDMQVAILLFAQ